MLELFQYFTDRNKARFNWIDINSLDDIIEKLSAEGFIRISTRPDRWHNRIRLTQNGREHFQVKAKELLTALVSETLKRLL